jgi:hypothetical protein
MALWSVLVYAPVAHWVWEPTGWLAKQGVLDFAGGLVVETASGVSAFTLAWLLGPSTGHAAATASSSSPSSPDAPAPAGAHAAHQQPHNLPFVLLGTGPVQSLPPRSVRDAVAAAGLGFEFMTTDAAARTYNLLASEGRRLACALIAV